MTYAIVPSSQAFSGTPVGVLHDWDLLSDDAGRSVVVGLRNGREWVTSEVLEIHEQGKWARTQNSLYALGIQKPLTDQGLEINSGGERILFRPVGFRAQRAPQLAGFRTSHGSIYQLSADGKTTRLKRSSGRGFGEIHEESLAVYVEPGVAQAILPLHMASESLRIGSFDPKSNLFDPWADAPRSPEGSRPLVVIFDRQSGRPLRSFAASLEPRVGLHPVEKAYRRDAGGELIGLTHIGNPIVEMLDAKAVAAVWPSSKPRQASFGDRVDRWRADGFADDPRSEGPSP